MKVLELECEEKLLILIVQSLNDDNGISTVKAIIKIVLWNYGISYKLIEVEYISTFILNNNRAIQIDYVKNSLNLIIY